MDLLRQSCRLDRTTNDDTKSEIKVKEKDALSYAEYVLPPSPPTTLLLLFTPFQGLGYINLSGIHLILGRPTSLLPMAL